jgi:hypothetical protein
MTESDQSLSPHPALAPVRPWRPADGPVSPCAVHATIVRDGDAFLCVRCGHRWAVASTAPSHCSHRVTMSLGRERVCQSCLAHLGANS